MGNYKVMLMGIIVLGGLVYLPILWLEKQHNDAKITGQEINYIFPVLIFLRLFGFLLTDSSFSLLDSCGLSMAKKYGGDFGQQKTWSMASMVVVPLLCGLFIDFISEYRGI